MIELVAIAKVVWKKARPATFFRARLTEEYRFYRSYNVQIVSQESKHVAGRFSPCYKQIWWLCHLVIYWATSVLSTNLSQGPSSSWEVLMLSCFHDYLTEETSRTRFTQDFQLGCYLMRHPAFTTSASVWSCWLLMDHAGVCAFFSYFLEYWLSQVPRFQYIYLQEAELIFMMFDENLGWRCHTKTCEHSCTKMG